MINRFRGWQGIAALVLSCSSTLAWAQLPDKKVSPLNHLGRSWGFGFSDGYHECPTCLPPAPRPKEVIRPAKEKTPPECTHCKKPSPFVLLNPFKNSTKTAEKRVHEKSSEKTNNCLMTVLPPTPEMYQQFAAPNETPLPGSCDQMDENKASVSQPQDAPPLPPASANDGAVADPLEQESAERNDLREVAPTIPDRAEVPPSPTLRKLKISDKPLGDEPTSSNPNTLRTSEPAKKVDDSLDLLPNDETPVTLHQQRQPGKSLLSKAAEIDSEPSKSSSRANDSMFQQYYGKTYSRSQMSIELEANRTNMNRYR